MPFPLFLQPLDPCNLLLSRCRTDRAKASRRILITKFGAHGDILMATPLLAALRGAYPDAYITWLVEHSNLQAIDASPYVDEVISWDGGYWQCMLSKRWKNLLRERRMLGLRWLLNGAKLLLLLRRRRVDVFVTMHPEQWPSLTRAVGAPVSIGLFPNTQEDFSRQKQWYTHTFAYPNLPRHRTDQYLLPLQSLAIPPTDSRLTIGYTTEDKTAADDFLRHNGIGDQSFVVVAPTTTWATRRWQPERYAALGDALIERGHRVVFIGSDTADDRTGIQEIIHQMLHVPVTALGVFGFRRVAALIGRASVLVSGDTGPMHVAAAVGTPYVALFGPTPVPGRAPLVGAGVCLMHPVPCGPCELSDCPLPPAENRQCMTKIQLPEVLEAVFSYLTPQPVVRQQQTV